MGRWMGQVMDVGGWVICLTIDGHNYLQPEGKGGDRCQFLNLFEISF